MLNFISEYRECCKLLKPYRRTTYTKDATLLYIERTNEMKNRLPTFQEMDAIALDVDVKVYDPAYMAKWSALTRKRNAGLLISYLYKVKILHSLDMTTVFAQRFLEGCVKRSVSNRDLLKAFGKTGRQADKKSADWDKLDELIEYHAPLLKEKLSKESEVIKGQLKVRAWNYTRQHFKRYGSHREI